jgi:hypothetical protein
VTKIGLEALARKMPQRDERLSFPATVLEQIAVIGRFKTSHSWALQNQPPLTGCYSGQFNKLR